MQGASKRSGGRAYFVSLVVAQACALTRYVVLARLLGPEQVGLAAIIVLTAQFFDSITDTGNDRFLIQDREGHSSAALKLVHLVAVIRGIAIAVILFLLADPIAAFTGAPQVGPGLKALALVPLVNGLVNYDFRLQQRDHQFAAEAKVVTSSEVIGLVATAIAAFLARDYTAILYGLTARAATAAIVSQLVASERYAAGYNQTLARRLWRFGAPLMLNGLLLFVSTQSDRIIISRSLGLEELGRYSVLLLLVYYPTAMVMRFVSALWLPLIAKARDDPQQQTQAAADVGGATLLLAAAIAVGFALIAPPLLPVIFGPAFRQDPALVALVGILMALRLMKVAPNTVAIALGSTSVVLANNLLRLSAVPAAFLGSQFGGLTGIVIGLIFGEMVANISATLMINRVARWGRWREFDRYVLFACLSAGVFAYGATSSGSDAAAEWLSFAAGAGMFLAICWHERVVVARAVALARAPLQA